MFIFFLSDLSIKIRNNFLIFIRAIEMFRIKLYYFILDIVVIVCLYIVIMRLL